MKKILDIIRRRIFGYDIFISYPRNDGLNYSYAIAQHFLDKGYECYIDQLSSTTPGAKLPRNIKNAVTRSTSFVLVGSISAQKSEPIAKEVKLFLEHSKNKPIIPISIEEAINKNAIWYNDIQGLAFIEDTESNLAAGAPEEEVLDRIENALAFTKKGDRLRRIFIATLIAIALIVCFVFYLVDITREKLDQADRARAVAEGLANKAVVEKKQADQEVIDTKGELANAQLELNKKAGTLTTLDTELSKKQEELIFSDQFRQDTQGKSASELAKQRTREREALNKGLAAITSPYTNKPTVTAIKGLSDAYYNYLIYRPVPIKDIMNIKVNLTNSSLVTLTDKDEVFILDSRTTIEKNKWKLASARGSIIDVDISENGQFITYIIKPNDDEEQQDYQMMIRDTENGKIFFSKSSEKIISYKLSPKGTYILINTAESGTLWNIKMGTKISIPHENVKEVLFSDYENVMVTYDKKEYPKVWNINKQGAFIHKITVAPEKISTLHLSKYGQAVFIGKKDNEIEFWNINKGKFATAFKGHSKDSIFYKLITQNEEYSLDKFKDAKGSYFIKANNLGINDIDEIETQERIVTASNDQSAILWHPGGHMMGRTQIHRYEVKHAKFSKEGIYLATACKEKVLLSDAANGRPLDVFSIFEHEIMDISFLAQNKLVILLNNGTSYIWTFFKDTSLYTFNHAEETIASAKFISDNKNIVTTDWNGNISVWDAKGQFLMKKMYQKEDTDNLLNILLKQETTVQSGNNQPFRKVVPNPFAEQKIDRTGNPTAPKPGERPRYSKMLSSIIAPDKKTILCQNYNGVGIVYRLEKNSIQFVSDFHLKHQLIQKATFIKNGTEIVVKPVSSMNCYIIETETGKILKTIPEDDFDKYYKIHPLEAKVKKIINTHNPSYRNFKITPDNKHFITVGLDRIVHLFRLSDGAVLSAFRAHTGRIYEVTVSSDGTYFMTIGEDRTAKLFETPYLNTIKKNAKELLKN